MFVNVRSVNNTKWNFAFGCNLSYKQKKDDKAPDIVCGAFWWTNITSWSSIFVCLDGRFVDRARNVPVCRVILGFVGIFQPRSAVCSDFVHHKDIQHIKSVFILCQMKAFDQMNVNFWKSSLYQSGQDYLTRSAKSSLWEISGVFQMCCR